MSITTTKKKKQAVDSNFSFKWDSSKQKAKSSATVLGKRKAIAKNTEKLPEKSTTAPTIVKTLAKTVKQQKDNKEKLLRIPKSVSKDDDETIPFEYTRRTSSEPQGHQGLVKRKQKKDKVLAKQLAQQGQSSEFSNTNSSSNEQKHYNLFNVRHKDIYVNTASGKSVSEKVFTKGAFKDLGIHIHIVSNLEKNGFKTPTNVQSKAIPVVCSGQNTLIRSQTGSGKTLAYVVPIIDALQGLKPRLTRTDGIQVIIVIPTRELAMQVHELFSKINTFQWIVVGHLCGGENRKTEKDRIKKGINVLIGTPGRLLDHVLHTTAMKIDQVRCLVLDEADRLLDMGFRKDIVSLVEALDKSKSNSEYDPMKILKQKKSSKTDIIDDVDDEEDVEVAEADLAPLKNLETKTRQNIMLSATLSKGVSELANFTMKEHTYIDALDITSNAIADSYVIPDTVRQEFIMTHAKHRLFTLSALLLAKSKQATFKLFVFMASTQMVEFHYELFRKHLSRMPVNRGANALNDSDDDDDEDVMDKTQFFKLHGSMDQKERKEVFTGFRASKKGILICTDVAARGIDVPDANCIIQYTGPQMDDDYLHRVGRTGRAGQSGSAIIFLTHEEQDYVNHLREHRVFLKKRDQEEYLRELSVVMEEPNHEQAATALQRHFEAAVERDPSLYKSACFAYSTWSRFYNSYPIKMRKYFDFKKANLGHYVTCFAIRSTPTAVARFVRGEVADVVQPRLNKKLANHSDNPELQHKRGKNLPSTAAGGQKRKMTNKSISFVTSEFSSGLEPLKKKKKIN